MKESTLKASIIYTHICHRLPFHIHSILLFCYFLFSHHSYEDWIFIGRNKNKMKCLFHIWQRKSIHRIERKLLSEQLKYLMIIKRSFSEWAWNTFRRKGPARVPAWVLARYIIIWTSLFASGRFYCPLENGSTFLYMQLYY